MAVTLAAVADDLSRPFAPVVLEALAGHGLRPSARTSIALLRAQVNDLYRYEIRQLRARLLAGDIVKVAYADHVRALRQRYLLLSLPVERWRD